MRNSVLKIVDSAGLEDEIKLLETVNELSELLNWLLVAW